MDDPVAHAESLVSKAEDLDNRITKQTEQVIHELVTYKHHAVKWQVATTLTMFVVIIMLLFGIFSVIKIRDNTASIQDFCESINASNAEQAKLWQFILDIPADPNETNAQKQVKVDFAALIDRTFAPQDCSTQRVFP